jgi:hypothetical protein
MVDDGVCGHDGGHVLDYLEQTRSCILMMLKIEHDKACFILWDSFDMCSQGSVCLNINDPQ